MVRQRSKSVSAPIKSGSIYTSDEDESGSEESHQSEPKQPPRPQSSLSNLSDTSDLVKDGIAELLIDKLIELEPEDSNTPYSVQLKQMDWSKVSIEGYPVDDLKLMLTKVISKIRKMRTLRCILTEVKRKFSDTSSRNPLHPKRPLGPWQAFSKMTYPKVKEEHPNWTNPEVQKHMKEMYYRLSEAEKKALVNDDERKKFKEDLKRFREEHPTKVKKLKKGKDFDMTPFYLYYTKFKHQFGNINEAKHQFATLDPKDKIVYLREFLLADKTRTLKDLSKTDKKVYLQALGKPVKTIITGYNYYQNKVYGEFAHLRTPLAFKEISKAWKSLSDEERDKYNRKAKKKVLEYNILYKKWLETLDEVDRKIINPTKFELGVIKRMKIAKEKRENKANGDQMESKPDLKPKERKTKTATKEKPEPAGTKKKTAAKAKQAAEPVASTSTAGPTKKLKQQKKKKDTDKPLPVKEKTPSPPPKASKKNKKKMLFAFETPVKTDSEVESFRSCQSPEQQQNKRQPIVSVPRLQSSPIPRDSSQESDHKVFSSPEKRIRNDDGVQDGASSSQNLTPSKRKKTNEPEQSDSDNFKLPARPKKNSETIFPPPTFQQSQKRRLDTEESDFSVSSSPRKRIRSDDEASSSQSTSQSKSKTVNGHVDQMKVEDTAAEESSDTERKKKKKKIKPVLVPEPEMPPDNAFTYYVNSRFSGEISLARNKWKKLKPSKREKYENEFNNVVQSYREQLKAYIFSLGDAEREEYKHRLKKMTKANKRNALDSDSEIE